MGKTSKDRRDIFYRLAKEQGWRARSAFKLLHIDQELNILEGVTRVVDLCASPGSWSQVLSKKLYEPLDDEQKKSVKIIAVDLLAIAPIPGVIQIQGDITKESTAKAIIGHFSDGQKAQLVVCDGAPDVTGLNAFDHYVQSQLVLATLNISTFVLEEGGTFIAKIFRGKYCNDTYLRLSKFFEHMVVAKPASCRLSSCEAFVVCTKYKCPANYIPRMIDPMIENIQVKTVNDTPEEKIFVPFVFCKDVNGFNSDTDYDLKISSDYTYKYHEVVQPPINPAYKQIVELKRISDIKSSAVTITYARDGSISKVETHKPELYGYRCQQIDISSIDHQKIHDTNIVAKVKKVANKAAENKKKIDHDMASNTDVLHSLNLKNEENLDDVENK